MTEQVTEQAVENVENVEIAEEKKVEAVPVMGEKGTGGQQMPTWKYSDGVPGSGDVPDWFLADKYRSVEEQAKAAHELRKKLGSKANDAPESYSLDYEKYGLEADDPVLKEFNPFFKEMNLPQGDYEKLVDKYISIQNAQIEQEQKQREEAFNSMPAEAKETVGRLKNWATNNFSADEQKIIEGFLNSPEEIALLDKLRSGAPKSAPPTANQIPSQANFETLQSINDEIGQNWAKMNSDASYRNMMNRKRAEAHKREMS